MSNAARHCEEPALSAVEWVAISCVQTGGDCFVVPKGLLAMTESRPRLPLQIQDTELET